MPHARDVLLLIQTATEWGRQLVRGISRYSQEREDGPWRLWLESLGVAQEPEVPEQWNGDGIIARVTTPRIGERLTALGKPVINVSWAGSHSTALPKVASDQIAAGRLAAEHFFELGFEYFGFVGSVEQSGRVDEMSGAFATRVEQAGFACRTFRLDETTTSASSVARVADSLPAWLREFDGPCGLLAWSEATGRAIINGASAASLPVPDRVAVLCADHDPLLASLGPISMSNLDLAPERIGYEAAALLDRLMEGDPSPTEPTLVPPRGVIQRRSTDTHAVDDPMVTEALTYLRNHADAPIRVLDLVEHLAVSRRRLEKRFTECVGRPPAVELRRIRMARAKTLLAETELSIPVIARRCGFTHVEVFIRAFRRETGMPPSVFRLQSLGLEATPIVAAT